MIDFGAAYYHEYQPADRLAEDLDLMAEAGFTVIRVGESVWSTWEPSDGVFDLDWLAPVLDGAHERGIRVLLGTPTYAIPPWLQRAHPEIAARRADGTPVPWGGRQEIDFTNPVFRRYAERVVRAIVSRYADHPAVIGYQVDNEPGPVLLYNETVFAGFVAWLRQRYGTVDELNRRWGLTYWSHRLSGWEELWRPLGNTTPSYDLAWRRYQAELVTEYIGWQARIVRELKRPDQFVTTCLAYQRAGVDDAALTAVLDVTAGNTYFGVQDELALPDPSRRNDSPWIGQGTWRLYLDADRMRGSRQELFLVTETGATSIGGSHYNFPPYDGQLRQVAWALIARGARMVEYWHWHTLHYGCETYWGGVLGHSLEPGRVYEEVRRLGSELRAAAPHLEGLRPDTDVTFLYSRDSQWAMEFQPPLGGSRSYERIFGAFYKGFFDIGCQAEVVDVKRLPQLSARVLVVPALYIADDATLDLLDGYARAGGHLVVTFRTGYADEEACARVSAGLALAGVRCLEFSNLRSPLPVTGFGEGAHATEWADGLIADDAEPLAWYEHPHFGRWPAVTTRPHGNGRVTYVGTLPDDALAMALARHVAQPSAWADMPASVTVTSARNAAGSRLWFVHNWSWDPVELTAPGELADVATSEPVRHGQPFELASWDVRVFTERAAATPSDGPSIAP
ncbi:MAG: beta-galactosidase [Streptosporangiaceae bacterium]